MKLVQFLLITFVLFGCKPVKTVHAQTSGYAFPYHLNQPSRKMILDEQLEEISGIDFLASSNQIIAVEDELGFLYYLNSETGVIEDRISFHKPGDYEDLAIADEIYVVKSSSTLYELDDLSAEEEKYTKHKTKIFEKTANVEGLCFDAQNNRLLLACKGNPYEEKVDTARYILGYDLKSETHQEKYVYRIGLAAMQSFLMTQSEEKQEIFASYFKPDIETLRFSPAAIDIHPKTGNIYVLSSRGKTLVVLNPTGKIIAVEKLDKKLHTQPEGLCFDDKGRLLISNEADGEVPLIFVFE